LRTTFLTPTMSRREQFLTTGRFWGNMETFADGKWDMEAGDGNQA
jgi:hypothetical protein